MTVLHISLGEFSDMKAGFLNAWKDAEAGKRAKPRHELIFRTYEDMHRVLSPARLDVVKALSPILTRNVVIRASFPHRPRNPPAMFPGR